MFYGMKLVFIEFDMESFILAYGDSGMSALVTLVAIVTTNVMERSILTHTHLVDIA